MFKRKCLAVVLTSALTVLFVSFYMFDGENEDLIGTLAWSGFLSFYVVPGVLFYGCPVSIVSDKLTKSLTGIQRVLLSLSVHLFFGISFVFIIGLFIATEDLFTNFNHFWMNAEVFFIAATAASVFFWLVDEILRYVFTIRR